MMVIGVRKSDFTGALITATDTAAMDFYGGEWRNNAFYYNTAVMHVNTTEIRNVYVNRTVIVNNNSHVAFNGGQGGVQARPTAQRES